MMSDVFEATVVVEVAAEQVWKALTERTLEAADDAERHLVLPGFPSLEPLPAPGASCTVLEVDPGRLLRVRKDHHPCQGTEIAIRLEHAATGTRITVVQSGFDAAFLELVGRDSVFGHGRQIVADLALYVQRGVFAPGRLWGAQLGATTIPGTGGLQIVRVHPAGFAARAGLQAGDLLVALRDVRVYDLGMLTALLAVTEAGSEGDVGWIRGNVVHAARAAF